MFFVLVKSEKQLSLICLIFTGRLYSYLSVFISQFVFLCKLPLPSHESIDANIGPEFSGNKNNIELLIKFSLLSLQIIGKFIIV